MLILASASKARAKLLEQVGIPHRVMVSGVVEEDFDSSDPIKLVKSLSRAKASAVLSRIILEASANSSLREINSVVACDSVFLFEDEILGKPKNSQEAISRWERMSSKSGFLITGHAFFYCSSKHPFRRVMDFDGLIEDAVSTRIEFEHLQKKEIENYVLSGEPFQCAGGFAIEGKGGMFIKKIEGCYSNVIGLSLPWLRKTLMKSSIAI